MKAETPTASDFSSFHLQLTPHLLIGESALLLVSLVDLPTSIAPDGKISRRAIKQPSRAILYHHTGSETS